MSEADALRRPSPQLALATVLGTAVLGVRRATAVAVWAVQGWDQSSAVAAAAAAAVAAAGVDGSGDDDPADAEEGGGFGALRRLEEAVAALEAVVSGESGARAAAEAAAATAAAGNWEEHGGGGVCGSQAAALAVAELDVEMCSAYARCARLELKLALALGGGGGDACRALVRAAGSSGLRLDAYVLRASSSELVQCAAEASPKVWWPARVMLLARAAREVGAVRLALGSGVAGGAVGGGIDWSGLRAAF